MQGALRTDCSAEPSVGIGDGIKELREIRNRAVEIDMWADDLRFGKGDMSHDGIERREFHVDTVCAHERLLSLIRKLAERHTIQGRAQNRKHFQARGLPEFDAIAGPGADFLRNANTDGIGRDDERHHGQQGCCSRGAENDERNYEAHKSGPAHQSSNQCVSLERRSD